MENFLVIDPFVHKEEHSVVDRSFLEYFSCFRSTVLVNETLKKNCDDLDLNFYPPFKDANSSRRFSRWLYREIYKVGYTLLILMGNLFHKRRVVFLAMSQFQFFVFGFVCFLLRIKASIVMHHYAEGLVKSKIDIKLSDKLFLIGHHFFNRLDTTRFLYLSKHIEKSIPFSEKNYFINHPIPKRMIDSVDVPTHIADERSIVNIATIGLLSPSRKSSHMINELNGGLNYTLWVVGRFAANEEFQISSHVKSKIWDGMYSNEEFQRAIKNMDCFIYFFDKEQYKCTASGTLIDAVLYGKHVLSLRNAAAESLLSNYEKKFFFDSVCEMNDFLQGNIVGSFRQNESNNIDSRYSYCMVSSCFPDVETLNSWLL